MPTKKYVDGVFLAFKHSLNVYEDLLRIFNLDACSCKVSLESYTLYIAIGMTAISTYSHYATSGSALTRVKPLGLEYCSL